MDDGYTFHEIQDRLCNDVEGVVRMLLPGVKRAGKELVIGNIHGAAGDSLKVNINNGIWSDFAGNEKGDLVELWSKVKGISKGKAKQEAEDYLGIGFSKTEEGSNYIPYKDGHLAGQWHYTNADGSTWCTCYRFNNPSKPGAKDFIPWDPAAQKYKRPEGSAPLFNLPKILANTGEPIYVVEGEGKVERLSQLGLTGTCSIGGARGSAKTDWSPVKGKHFITWRDNDTSGLAFEEDAIKHLKEHGAASVRRVKIPAGKPQKWDCKDATDEEIKTLTKEATESSAEHVGRRSMVIEEWGYDVYAGEPPPQRWLVEGVIPQSRITVLCAAGDAGKGLLTMDLALKVVTGQKDLVHPTMAFGREINEFGSAVILAAEDDQPELHRRVTALDPDNKRGLSNNRIYLVPLPNLGGPQVYVRSVAAGKTEVTKEYEDLREQLRRIPNLKLLVIDPISTFFALDMNDQSSSYYAMSAISALCTELDLTIVLVHHMNKGNMQHPISSPAEARNAVKGSGAFVDAARSVYALWPVEDKYCKKICVMLDEKPERSRVFQGAVVKSNSRADMTIRTYMRSLTTGLLQDVTAQLQKIRDQEKVMRTALMDLILKWQEDGEPLQVDDERLRNERILPLDLHGTKPDKIQRILAEAVGKRQLVIQHELMGKKIDFFAFPGRRFAENVKPVAEKMTEELL